MNFLCDHFGEKCDGTLDLIKCSVDSLKVTQTICFLAGRYLQFTQSFIVMSRMKTRPVLTSHLTVRRCTPI